MTDNDEKNMTRLLNPAALAYIGDAVFELLVRGKYISGGNLKAGRLHKKTIQVVCAASQAKMADKLLDVFTNEELAIYKRGRNTAVSSMPKNAKLSEYCKATGFEAVFGFLYLSGRGERLLEIFEKLEIED